MAHFCGIAFTPERGKKAVGDLGLPVKVVTAHTGMAYQRSALLFHHSQADDIPHRVHLFVFSPLPPEKVPSLLFRHGPSFKKISLRALPAKIPIRFEILLSPEGKKKTRGLYGEVTYLCSRPHQRSFFDLLLSDGEEAVFVSLF
jgi:hypothetical protein